MRNSQCNLVSDLILFLCILSTAFSQESVSGKQLKATTPASTNQNCENNWGPKCADCLHLLTCAGDIQINSQPCSSINSQRPYCSNDACVASLDNSESCIAQDYVCTGVGQYPDPNDCRRYYICDKSNADAAPSVLQVYECPPNFVYDSKSGLCTRSICRNIDCSRTPNQYVISSTDPSILIYCYSDGNGGKAYVFRCPDPKNMQYDKDTWKCAFKCTREGRFADRMKCTMFYDCFWSINGYQSNHVSCPPGYAFDANSLQCVKAPTCINQIDRQTVDTTQTN